MAATARLEGKLTLNDAEFTAALNRAESRSRTFSGRVKGAFSDFGLKNESRVSRQFGALTSGLLTARNGADALQSAFTALEYSTKVPIGVGLGLAAGVAVFEKVREQIEATRKAEEHFQETMNRPIGLQSQLSSGDLTKEIDLQKEALSGLQEQLGTYTQSVIDTFSHGFGVKLPFIPKSGEKSAFDLQDERQAEQVKAMEKLDALAKARGEAELGVAKAQEESLRGSQLAADMERITTQFAEKRAAIRLGGLDPGSSARLQALNLEESLAKEVAIDKANASEREFQSAMKIARARAEGRSADLQSLDAMKEHLSNVEAELTTNKALSDEKRKQLAIDQQNTVMSIAAAQYAEKNKSPEQRAKERHEAQRFQQFVRGMTPSNPNAYITHPDAYTTSPDAYNRAGEVGFNPNGRDYQRPQFRNDLAGFNPGMDTFGGSDSFNKFFHPSGESTGFDPSKSRNNTNLTKKEYDQAQDNAKPLTKGDMKDIMDLYWKGD